MGRLRDKIVLITGAAGAVGSAVSDAVVQNGGIAVTTDLPHHEDVDHVLDVTSEEDWRRVIAELEAGAGGYERLLENLGDGLAGCLEQL